MKYRITDIFIQAGYLKLHRIKALKDFGNVRAGDIGGFIESERNLSQEGDCWVYDDAKVYGDARILHNATIHGNALIRNSSLIAKNAHIYNFCEIRDKSCITDNAILYGHIITSGTTTIHGDAKVASIDRIVSLENVHIAKNAFITCPNDVLCIGPIGSRNAYTTFYKTKNDGIWVCSGCFNGPIKKFKRRVFETHHDTAVFLHQYLTAIDTATELLKEET